MSDTQIDRYMALHHSFWFGSGKGDVRYEFYRRRFVKTRRPHGCAHFHQYEPQHGIPAGSYAVFESAKIDGKVGSCYTCLPCLEKWATECGRDV